MAHEIGHNLGMEHDFVGNGNEGKAAGICRMNKDYRISKKCSECAGLGNDKECCTGFMDYGEHPNYWSDCSVRMFEQHYVSQGWKKCLPEGTNIIT